MIGRNLLQVTKPMLRFDSSKFCICYAATALISVQAQMLEAPALRHSGNATNQAVDGAYARANRHALIIEVGEYADPKITPLPGAKHDKKSATEMAKMMQIPQANIRYLSNKEATGHGIRDAIQRLGQDVVDGDRVFIYYTGHGTRYKDEQAGGGCTEALLAHDGGWSGTISNREMSSLLKPITVKADKLFVVYDACFSGGVVNLAVGVPTRGLSSPGAGGILRPKFTTSTEECGRAVNIKTRNLVVEQVQAGTLPQDIIHISSSRDNEVSFDDEQRGGLATQYLRDCMLGEAKDLDLSGAITIEEIRQCAQEKINRRLSGSADFKPHNLVLNGNEGFIPSWLGTIKPQPTPVVTGTTLVPANKPSAATLPSMPAANTSALPVGASVMPAARPQLSGAQALQQIFDQRDAKRVLKVRTAEATLKIGKDSLNLSIESDRKGYVYVALAGSDNKSLYLLFPNKLDTNNVIERGKPLALPRANWKVVAAGPEGQDSLLVMVADGPRNLSALSVQTIGPFAMSLNDAQGRAQLGTLLSASQMQAGEKCSNFIQRLSNGECSDAYAAAMISIREIK